MCTRQDESSEQFLSLIFPPRYLSRGWQLIYFSFSIIDFFGWPASQSCSFPSWLTASTWFLVANTHHIFEASDSNDTIIVRSTLSSPSVIHKSFKCLKIDQPNSTSPTSSMQIQVLTQAFNKWSVERNVRVAGKFKWGGLVLIDAVQWKEKGGKESSHSSSRKTNALSFQMQSIDTSLTR